MVEDEEEKRGYSIVRTPSCSRAEIYMIEDRWEQEKDDIFKIEDEEEMAPIMPFEVEEPTNDINVEDEEDEYDLQKELEAKFDELFGPIEEDNK